MKKIILASILMVLSLANADACCYRGYYHPGYGIAPFIVGGVIGYELANPRPIVVPQPVYIQPAPVIVQNPINPPVGYHYMTIQDPSCNCTKQALVPN